MQATRSIVGSACAAAKGCHAPAEVDIAAVGDATAATTGASGCTAVSIGTTSGLTAHPRADQYPKAAFDDEDWDQELENACRQAESASVASRSNETNLSTSPLLMLFINGPSLEPDEPSPTIELSELCKLGYLHWTKAKNRNPKKCHHVSRAHVEEPSAAHHNVYRDAPVL